MCCSSGEVGNTSVSSTPKQTSIITIKKRPQVIKCSDHRTISLIAHTAKIIAKILSTRIEKKIEDVLGDQFGFRRANELGMQLGC